MSLNETVPANIAHATGGGCQYGQCGSCKLMRSLAGKLRISGLEVKAMDCLGRTVDVSGQFEEIEVDNPNSPARGVFRITDKGEVMWVYFASLDSEHAMNQMVGIVTKTLCAVPQEMPAGTA